MEYFAPGELRENPEALHRATLVAGLAMLGGAFGSAYASFYFAIGHIVGAWVIVVCTISMVFVPFIIRKTGRLRLAGNLHCLTWTLGFSALAALEGGVHGHAIAWLACGVPLLALLILDMPTALIWCVLCFSATLFFCVLDVFNIVLPLAYPASWHAEVTAAGYIGFAVFMSLLGVIFEHSRRQAFCKMQLAYRRMAEANRRSQESERFVQANQAKDDFIAALSHELRTPLTPVLMVAAMLEKDETLDSERRDQLRLVRQNVELEARLIDDLLDLTKVARGKFSLKREPTDLQEVLGRAVEIVRSESERKRIGIHLNLEARFVNANADPTRLQQVFWNLLRNAIKFTQVGGRIDVHTFDSSSQTFSLEVRDSGVGIPPAELGKIFLPFEQGAVGGNHQFGGLGLGLAISKAIVDLHGGSISVASEGLNRGAVFTASLPVSRTAQSPSITQEVLPPEATPIPHLHILLVEDNEPTRRVLARLLSREGHEVETAGDCAAAREVAHHQSPGDPIQVLISDLGLPDGSGLNLVREIRLETPAIRAIALSGYGTEDDIRKSLQAGFSAHLTKPVAFEDLRRTLAAA